MSKLKGILTENRSTLALAVPIMAGHVGQMLMGAADSIMVGRVGVLPLAASAFANAVLSIFLVGGFGLLSAVTMRSAQFHGAQQARKSGEVLRAGLVLSVLAGAAMALMVHASMPWLYLLGQPPEVNAEARWYLVLVGWSMVPVFVMTSGKHFSEALSRPWPPFWITIAGVLLNVILNWFCIYGKWGVPAMGLAGAGLATLLARLACAVALLSYLRTARGFQAHLPEHPLRGFRWERVWDLLRLGSPVAGQLLIEVGAFSVAAMMMGWISVNALAAHQIALTCAATTFMFPLGLSMAVTVRVGQAIGAGERSRVRAISVGALCLAAMMMAAFALMFLIAGRGIAEIFVSDPAVIALTARLLIVAGLFQIFDGSQVVGIGALRGLTDVHFPVVTTFVAYWLVALPLGGALAFGADLGSIGIWAGLAVGLAVAAVLLARRLWLKSEMGGECLQPVVAGTSVALAGAFLCWL